MFEIPSATRPPRLTRSADGTTIAYDVYGSGDGPLVVVVGGATNTRLFTSGLGQALAAAGCVGVVYDRRGRGDSTDTAPYTVEREIEDLGAVVEAVRPDGTGVAVGFSSGAALVLRATAGGAPIARAVTFEPPYRLPDSPPLPERYIASLEAFNSAGDGSGALEYFQTQAVGLPQAMVDGMKGTPFWDYFAAVAPTIVYDGYCLGGDDQSFPVDLVAGIEAPILALASTGSPPFLQNPARLVEQHGQQAHFELVDGSSHTAPDDVLAARVAAFASAPGASFRGPICE